VTVTDAPADPFAAPGRPKPPLFERGRYKIPHYDPATPDGIKRDANGDPMMRKPMMRVSSFAKLLSDEEKLNEWAQRCTAYGIATNESYRALAAAQDWPSPDWRAKRDFNDLVDRAKDWAQASTGADMGTALHKFVEQYKRGQRVTVPEEWAPKVAAYQDALTRYGLTPYLQEQIVINETVNVVGRFDDVVREEHTGKLYLKDTKTSASLYTYDAFAIQFAVYANAELIFDYDAYTIRPMVDVDKDVALLSWLPLVHPSGEHRCDIVDVPIRRAWEHAARVCRDVLGWRKEAKDIGSIRPLPHQTREQSWEVRLRNAASPGDLSAVWREADAAGAWTAELEAIGKARMAQLQPGVA
jgi:hypothetical protein